MFVKVGLHRAKTIVYFREEHLPEIEAKWRGRSVSVDVREDSVCMMPSNRGPHLCEGQERSHGEGWTHRVEDRTTPVCRAHTFLAPAEWQGMRLIVTLPPPHLLPWPKEYEEHHRGKRDDIVDDLRRRLDSAGRHTGDRRMAVPGNVLVVLTDQEQERLFTCWQI